MFDILVKFTKKNSQTITTVLLFNEPFDSVEDTVCTLLYDYGEELLQKVIFHEAKATVAQ